MTALDNNAGSDPAEREPGEHSLGMMLVDFTQGPSGYPFFLWFESREELADYISGALADYPAEELEEDVVVVRARLAPLAERVRCDAIGIAELAELSEEALGGTEKIGWVGSFAALCTAVDSVTAEVRAAYWSAKANADDHEHDEEGPQPAVPREEWPAFIAFLRSYGA